MKIDLLCPSGSPVGVTPMEIYSKGVGGAELAMLTWVEAMRERGHQVRVYNDPRSQAEDFLPIAAFEAGEKRDAVILFRNPDSRYRNANGKHIFWSCDQYTDGNYNRDILPWTDTVVGISPRHHEYFTHNYRWPAKKMSVIDLPVRAQDYKPFLSEIKEEGLCLFCSVPERGLLQLRPLWNRILARVPNASLVVTSDYRLWGGDHGTTEYRMAWIGTKKVQYLGMIDRMQLALLQCKSMVQVYPCIYDELFCIATAECQYTGAVPVTSYSGALVSTNRAGILVEGTPGTEQFDAVFVDWVVTMLTDKETYQKQSDLCKQVAQIDFSVDLFTMRWEALLNE